MKKILFFALLAAAIFAVSCTSEQEEATEVNSELDSFAECLSSKGVKMYGSMTCTVCKRQKELFGPSFQHIGEIECHPRGENPQTQLCLEKDIAKTPTWILEKDGVELKRLEGYQTLETLSELCDCGCSVEEK